MATTIGHVKRDLHVNERTLEANYPALDNPLGLRLLLGDYNALINRQYQGDYDSVIIIADLHKAIEMAGLTAKQRQALELTFLEDLTQEEAGKRLGVSQQAVEQHVDKAVEAIAEIYWYWCGHKEGYTLNG